MAMDEFAIDLDKVLDEFEESEDSSRSTSKSVSATAVFEREPFNTLEPPEPDLDLSEADFAPAPRSFSSSANTTNGEVYSTVNMDGCLIASNHVESTATQPEHAVNGVSWHISCGSESLKESEQTGHAIDGNMISGSGDLVNGLAMNVVTLAEEPHDARDAEVELGTELEVNNPSEPQASVSFTVFCDEIAPGSPSPASPLMRVRVAAAAESDSSVSSGVKSVDSESSSSADTDTNSDAAPTNSQPIQQQEKVEIQPFGDMQSSSKTKSETVDIAELGNITDKEIPAVSISDSHNDLMNVNNLSSSEATAEVLPSASGEDHVTELDSFPALLENESSELDVDAVADTEDLCVTQNDVADMLHDEVPAVAENSASEDSQSVPSSPSAPDNDLSDTTDVTDVDSTNQPCLQIALESLAPEIMTDTDSNQLLNHCPVLTENSSSAAEELDDALSDVVQEFDVNVGDPSSLKTADATADILAAQSLESFPAPSVDLSASDVSKRDECFPTVDIELSDAVEPQSDANVALEGDIVLPVAEEACLPVPDEVNVEENMCTEYSADISETLGSATDPTEQKIATEGTTENMRQNVSSSDNPVSDFSDNDMLSQQDIGLEFDDFWKDTGNNVPNPECTTSNAAEVSGETDLTGQPGSVADLNYQEISLLKDEELFVSNTEKVSEAPAEKTVEKISTDIVAPDTNSTPAVMDTAACLEEQAAETQTSLLTPAEQDFATGSEPMPVSTSPDQLDVKNDISSSTSGPEAVGFNSLESSIPVDLHSAKDDTVLTSYTEFGEIDEQEESAAVSLHDNLEHSSSSTLEMAGQDQEPSSDAVGFDANRDEGFDDELSDLLDKQPTGGCCDIDIDEFVSSALRDCHGPNPDELTEESISISASCGEAAAMIESGAVDTVLSAVPIVSSEPEQTKAEDEAVGSQNATDRPMLSETVEDVSTGREIEEVEPPSDLPCDAVGAAYVPAPPSAAESQTQLPSSVLNDAVPRRPPPMTRVSITDAPGAAAAAGPPSPGSPPPPYSGPPMCTNINLAITQLGVVPPIWMQDSEAMKCMQCEAPFSFTRRRHHCRACGRIFCSGCCSLKAALQFMENKEARVCSVCYQELIRAQTYMRSHPNAPGHTPNPSNPSEYCSTLPPQAQVSAGAEAAAPLSVMVPTGVLRKQGSIRSTVEPKQVMFSDGIRPGGDLTELDGAEAARAPAAQSTGRKTKKVEKPGESAAAKTRKLFQSKKLANLVPDTGFPPLVLSTSASRELSFNVNPSPELIAQQLQNGDEAPVVTFAINRNLFVFVRIAELSCCMRRKCWCISTRGLCTVGQDEVVILLECLPDEKIPPVDVLRHISQLYEQAGQGNTISHLGHMVFVPGSFGSHEVGGYLFMRPSYQCLQQLVLPEPPYLFAILLQKWELPWARVFPLRLMLRLGAEFRYYPCPLVSVRSRKPVYGEIGHTIMNLLADFHNYQYSLPQIPGLVIHMEDKKTFVRLPRDRYDAIMKVLSNSDDHVMALGASFSVAADSHLVCLQNDDGNYQTQAINIQNRPRQVTGACFIVFNGALKSSSGLRAKSSIVEDGLMVQITAESMVALKQSLRQMKDYTIGCGTIVNPQPDEVVTIEWTAEERNSNAGVKSPVDGRSMTGIDSVRVHTATDYAGVAYTIRWTELFFISHGTGNPEGGPSDPVSPVDDPADLSRLAEHLAQAFCLGLTPHLEALAFDMLTKIGLRVTVGNEQVGYEVGSQGARLPDFCMNDLDEKLIPVINSAVAPRTGADLVIELVFHVLHQTATLDGAGAAAAAATSSS